MNVVLLNAQFTLTTKITDVSIRVQLNILVINIAPIVVLLGTTINQKISLQEYALIHVQLTFLLYLANQMRKDSSNALQVAQKEW